VIESGESRPPKLGRYELITQIGQGGMAEVQLALQRGPAGFEKLVVVKLVHENLASQKAFVDMLLDEARVAALVKHPNVVDIYDLGEAEGRYFIAMEYLEGEPLLAVLRAGRDGQRLDVLSTARLIADTAEGLDAAHELRSMAGDPIELVHHDVSLGNIVVLYNGQVKLVDFGVAKATQSATAHNKVQGKFSYMAPEKLRGDPGDRRSDIWSLGCVLWEALTLRRLFRGGNESETVQLVLENVIVEPSKINGDVPVDFDSIVMRSLQRDPTKRYPTAKAMAADLEEVLRKHGYAAKNDVIARYMQTTFHARIAARKKLLQEVSSKGRASADVLEAAFHDGAMASGTPILSTGGLVASRFRRSDSLSGPLPTLPRKPPPLPSAMRRTDESVSELSAVGSPVPTTTFAATSQPLAPLGLPATTRATRESPVPAIADAVPATSSAGDDRTIVEPPRVGRGRRWIVVAAGSGVVALVLALGVLVTRGDDNAPGLDHALAQADEAQRAAVASRTLSATTEPAPTQPESAQGTSSQPESTQPVPTQPVPTQGAPTQPAPTQPAPTQGTSSQPARAQAEPSQPPPSPPPASRAADTASSSSQAAEPTTKTSRPAVRRAQASRPSPAAKPSPDKTSAEDLVKMGLQAWVHGDLRTAHSSYRRAIEANAAYAPAWRCLGLVYEKQGNRSSARSAFQRYLELAPGASDAAGIRAKLETP
jgi:serine/threonine protein kinase/outer membrane biosynthesis protein TonB